MKQLSLTLCLWMTVAYAAFGQQDPTSSRPNLPGGAFRVASLDGPGLNRNVGFEEFEAAKIIARVGDDVVLAGDLFGQVNQFLHNRIKEIPEEQRSLVTPEMLNEQRWQLIKQVLPSIIDGKLLYLDFLRSIPKENIPEIQDSLYRAFDEQQLPLLIERSNVKTAADLDQQLRSFGSSLDQQRRTFAEQLAAAQWRERHATSKEVSHEDLLAYYREHQQDYRIESRCKWEQLSAHDTETFSRQKSRTLVAAMGNEIIGGASFAAVAKKKSHGVTASAGGKYDWTTKGSLRSDEIDEAIFSLPVGYLSKIIEDDLGCHIVRVIERQEASMVPFAEVQDAIRKKIQKARSDEVLSEYIAKLRSQVPVQTIFDDES